MHLLPLTRVSPQVVVSPNGNSVFMVMEFVEHDLRALLEKELRKHPLSTAQVGCGAVGIEAALCCALFCGLCFDKRLSLTKGTEATKHIACGCVL